MPLKTLARMYSRRVHMKRLPPASLSRYFSIFNVWKVFFFLSSVWTHQKIFFYKLSGLVVYCAGRNGMRKMLFFIFLTNHLEYGWAKQEANAPKKKICLFSFFFLLLTHLVVLCRLSVFGPHLRYEETFFHRFYGTRPHFDVSYCLFKDKNNIHFFIPMWAHSNMTETTLKQYGYLLFSHTGLCILLLSPLRLPSSLTSESRVSSTVV